MNKEDIIHHAAIYQHFPDSDETDLIAELVKTGLPKADAERLIAFLPIAFGRQLIERTRQVSFSDEFIINETQQRFRLSDEPIFRIATELARDHHIKQEIPEELFLEIAFSSVEAHLVVQIQEQGESANGAKFDPVELWAYTTFNA